MFFRGGQGRLGNSANEWMRIEGLRPLINLHDLQSAVQTPTERYCNVCKHFAGNLHVHGN